MGPPSGTLPAEPAAPPPPVPVAPPEPVALVDTVLVDDPELVAEVDVELPDCPPPPVVAAVPVEFVVPLSLHANANPAIKMHVAPVFICPSYHTPDWKICSGTDRHRAPAFDAAVS